MTTVEQENRYDQLGDLCTAYHGLVQAAHLTDSTITAEADAAINERTQLVVNQIADRIRSYPGMLVELEERTKAYILSDASLAGNSRRVSDKSSEAPNSHYTEGLYENIGRHSLVLAGLTDLRTTQASNEKIKRGFDHRTFTGEIAPGATIEVNLESKIYINDQELKLTPTQRLIIDKLLDAEGVVAYKDIYTSSDFMTLIEGTKTPPVVHLTNNVRSIHQKCEKLGAHQESLVANAGPKNSALLQLNPNSEVLDESVLGKTRGLASYMLDMSILGESFDPVMLARSYFERSSLGARFTKAIDSALIELTTQLSATKIKMIRSVSGEVTLMQEDTSSSIQTAIETGRGPIVSIEADKIRFRDGVVQLSSEQACILSHLTQGIQRGKTRAYIRDQLKRGGFQDNNFDVEFNELKLLLGDKLKRWQQEGRTRFSVAQIR